MRPKAASLAARGLERGLPARRLNGTDLMPRPPPPARRLDESGRPDLLATAAPLGSTRRARPRGEPARLQLVAGPPQRCSSRPTQHEAGPAHGLSEGGTPREEPVAGIHRVHPGRQRRSHELSGVEVRATATVSSASRGGTPPRRREPRRRRHRSQVVSRSDEVRRDLTTVRDEEPGDRRHARMVRGASRRIRRGRRRRPSTPTVRAVRRIVVGAARSARASPTTWRCVGRRDRSRRSW